MHRFAAGFTAGMVVSFAYANWEWKQRMKTLAELRSRDDVFTWVPHEPVKHEAEVVDTALAGDN